MHRPFKLIRSTSFFFRSTGDVSFEKFHKMNLFMMEEGRIFFQRFPYTSSTSIHFRFDHCQFCLFSINYSFKKNNILMQNSFLQEYNPRSSNNYSYISKMRYISIVSKMKFVSSTRRSKSSSRLNLNLSLSSFHPRNFVDFNLLIASPPLSFTPFRLY